MMLPMLQYIWILKQHINAHAEVPEFFVFVFLFVFCICILPVANKNHLSLIVPLKSLLNQTFHLGEVFSCKIIMKIFTNSSFVVMVADHAHWQPFGSRRVLRVYSLPWRTLAAPACDRYLPSPEMSSAKTMANYLYQSCHNHGKVGGERAHALVNELNAWCVPKTRNPERKKWFLTFYIFQVFWSHTWFPLLERLKLCGYLGCTLAWISIQYQYQYHDNMITVFYEYGTIDTLRCHGI